MSYQFHTLAAGLTNGVRRDDPSVLGAEFPERPDALRRFLKGLHSGWNISLFHYRNHGAGACYMHLSMPSISQLRALHTLQTLGRC